MTESADDIDRLIALMAKLPGFGPRSARRAVLALIRRRESRLRPLAEAMRAVAENARICVECGNVCTAERCDICLDPVRDPSTLCVVAEIGDLWALERSGAFRGRYHVLGGLLSALDGIGPDELGVPRLLARAANAREAILALPATIDGQTTAHMLREALAPTGVAVTSLAQGVPVGGELDYLDDGTLSAALRARRSL